MANYLGISPDRVSVSDYDKQLFCVDGDEIALVLTDAEADARFEDNLQNLLDDVGLADFCNEGVLYNCLSEDFFNELWDEYINDEADDMTEDELKEYFLGDDFDEEEDEEEGEYEDRDWREAYVEKRLAEIDNPIEEYFAQFGREDLKYLFREHPECVDLNKLFEEIKSSDGRGNTLASWDGVEIDSEEYYIYFQNDPENVTPDEDSDI